MTEANEGPASRTEVMTISAARMLADKEVCFVGIGLPSTASNLARLTHAPNLVLIYESGPIGAKPSVLPLSIGDGELAETADVVVSTPEIFRYYLQGGRIDVGFLGAAQLDRFANINTTVIGDYRRPTTRLPGAGGAPEIAACAKKLLIIVKQTRRSFVEKLDFITTVGHGTGRFSRGELGLIGNGPAAVITDLCILEPDPESAELTVTHLYPGVTRQAVRDATSWPIRFAATTNEIAPIQTYEIETLRDLKRRTALAHSGNTNGRL